MIDAISVYPGSIGAGHIILGILGTISLIMVNSVTQAQVHLVKYSEMWHDKTDYFQCYFPDKW